MIETMGFSLRRFVLLGPGLLWLAVFLVVPCALVFTYSFFERGVYGGIDYIFSFGNYERAVDALYLRIFFKSFQIAALTTVAALLIGYPAAAFIASQPPRRQKALLVLAILPFWSNYLIRTYAWMVLLNREGLINRALAGMGLIDEPLPLLYNDLAIVVGLLYAYLPFMILTLYASIARLGPELREASTDLGGNTAQTFVNVTLPLTVPGIAAGCVFVFVLSIGNFITPDLLGGGRSIMVGNLIYDQFLSARDWPFGASLAFILIGVMLSLLFVQAWLVNRSSGGRETVRG
jgi:spermidine/putrescine transport system permease protein